MSFQIASAEAYAIAWVYVSVLISDVEWQISVCFSGVNAYGKLKTGTHTAYDLYCCVLHKRWHCQHTGKLLVFVSEGGTLSIIFGAVFDTYIFYDTFEMAQFCVHVVLLVEGHFHLSSVWAKKRGRSFWAIIIAGILSWLLTYSINTRNFPPFVTSFPLSASHEKSNKLNLISPANLYAIKTKPLNHCSIMLMVNWILRHA